MDAWTPNGNGPGVDSHVTRSDTVLSFRKGSLTAEWAPLVVRSSSLVTSKTR